MIRPATRKGVRPIIDLYGESGCGKTYSALLLARGFVGPKGKMVMIDSEEGRGELYADVSEIGGYEVLPLGEPFSPKHYIAAIDEVEKSGASIGILDSGSHEWEGISGVLDMAESNREKSGAAGLHNWRVPKMEHALFLQKLLRSPIPWIICLRAKFKTRQVKENGKTVIVKDDYPTPIQADDFIFESTVHGLIDPEHNFLPRKISHPDLQKCLPSGKPLTIEHGRLLAEWCAMGGVATSSKDKNALLAELRAITEPIHGWHASMPKTAWVPAKGVLEKWLAENGIIGPATSLAELDADRLSEVITETKAALK